MESATTTSRSSSSSSSSNMRAISITALFILMVFSFMLIDCMATRPYHDNDHDPHHHAKSVATSSHTDASINDATTTDKESEFDDEKCREAGARIEIQGTEEERKQWKMDVDECLMKRSLLAHLDYIYTQNHTKFP